MNSTNIVKQMITVEEAKAKYHESWMSAGREFRQIIAILDGEMYIISKVPRHQSSNDEEEAFKIFEEAQMLFDGGF